MLSTHMLSHFSYIPACSQSKGMNHHHTTGALCLLSKNLLRKEAKIPLILIAETLKGQRFPILWIQVRPSLGTAKVWLYVGETLLQVSQKWPGLLIQPILVQLQ